MKRYTGDNPWTNYDWLYTEYIIKDRRTKEIAGKYGCKQNTIQCWLKKHGISKKIERHVRDKRYKYEYYDYLYHEHIELNKSISEIAIDNNVSYDTIVYNLKKNNIPIQKRNRHKKYTQEEIDIMEKMYCVQHLSAFQIAMHFNTDHNTIIRNLKKRDVKIRTQIEAQFNSNNKDIPDIFNDAETLRRWHWDDGKSCKDIGDILNIDAGTVRRQMHRLGIDTKSNSMSKIGLMIGESHPNWQGGITPLNALLREYFNINQAPVIAERDNYTCQLCGAQHTVLHVHHIREFSDIVHEICSENNTLNPNDENDKQKLYNIITHDSRFLDMNNLITYCKECHLFRIHNYKHKIISSQASEEEGSETIP